MGIAQFPRFQELVTMQALSAAFPLQGIKRTAGSHPSKGECRRQGRMPGKQFRLVKI